MNSLKKIPMKRPLWAIALLLILGSLSACAQETTSPVQSLITSSPSSTATPKSLQTGTPFAATSTKSPTATETPLSEPASLVTIASTPYPLPTLALGTPGPGVPLAENAISLSNVSQVRQQARLGKGVINDSSYAPIANMLAVATSLGVCVYDARTLAEVRCIDTGGWTFSVAISPDGHTLAASTIDGVRLWRVDDGSVLRPLTDETGPFTDWAGRMAFSPDGKILATIVPSGSSVHLWRVRDGRLLRRLFGEVESYGGSSDPCVLVFSPDGKTVAVKAWGSPGDRLEWWRVSDGALINTVQYVSAFAFAADGQTLATAVRNIIQLWRVSDAQPIAIFEGPSDWEIRALDFAPDGQTLAAAIVHFSYDSGDAYPVVMDQIHLWRVRDGALLLTIDGAGDVIDSLAFAPDGKSLASASSTNAVVRLWQVSDGALLITSENVFTPAVTPNNYWDYTSQLWWTPNSSLLQQLYGHSEAYWSAGIDMSGFYSQIDRSFSQTARLWRMSDGTLINSLDHHSGAMETLAFSPDGTTLAAGASDGSIRFWRTGDFAAIHLIAQESDVISLAFSPDSQYLATLGNDGDIRMWRVSDGVLLYRLDWQDDPIGSIAFSPDGQFLATAGNVVQLWRVTDGTLIRTLEEWEAFYYSRAIDFSPDGKTIAAASWGNLNLWRAMDGAELWAAEAEEIGIESIDAIAFAPDGKTLAVGGSASNGNLGALIDVSTGMIVRMLKADGDEDWSSDVHDLAFSSDGQILAAYAERGYDMVVYLWEAGDGAILRSLEGHRSTSGGTGINIFHKGAVAFSPDGLWLASASADGTVIIWAIIPPEDSTQMISDTGDVACALRRNQSVHLLADTRLWSAPDVSKASIVATVSEDTAWAIRSGPTWGKITTDLSGWWWDVSQSEDGSSDGWVWEGRIQECQ